MTKSTQGQSIYTQLNTTKSIKVCGTDTYYYKGFTLLLSGMYRHS